MKDVQATGEASSPQKMTSSTSNNKSIHFSPFILLLWALIKKTLQSMIGGKFCPHLDPDPADQNQCGSMRIRIQINNADFVYESKKRERKQISENLYLSPIRGKPVKIKVLMNNPTKTYKKP
jgi:hypothetical protein